MGDVDLTIAPACEQWHGLLHEATEPQGSVFGRTLTEWRAVTRSELGLAVDRTIVATGHQTLLWHPGILVKYLAVEAFCRDGKCARANLVVDQHADAFGTFELPVRRSDGALAVRRIALTVPRPGVPMGLHEPFDPPALPALLHGVTESVDVGARRIVQAVAGHRHAANAAVQMAGALEELMHPWVSPLPRVTASDLLNTTFARILLHAMSEEPQRCARLYNAAVRAFPEAGIGQMLVRDDYVELPIWWVRDDGTRMYGYDNDVQTWLHDGSIRLMPRALLMTALVRLVMCDLFVHGTGGANYDRAMEHWITNWLGVTPAPIAVATATLRLPIDLRNDLGEDSPIGVEAALQKYRHAWHDPARFDEVADAKLDPLSDAKRTMLAHIEAMPYRSLERRSAFYQMHERLDEWRTRHDAMIAHARRQYDYALRHRDDLAIAQRRDWAFALYPERMLDELAAAVQSRLHCSQGQI